MAYHLPDHRPLVTRGIPPPRPPSLGDTLQVGAPTNRDTYVQRIGRTGRAGRAGSGTLLLCNYEAGFMSQVRDLPRSPSFHALLKPSRHPPMPFSLKPSEFAMAFCGLRVLQLDGLAISEAADATLGTAEELAKVQAAAARVTDEVATQTYAAPSPLHRPWPHGVFPPPYRLW